MTYYLTIDEYRNLVDLWRLDGLISDRSSCIYKWTNETFIRYGIELNYDEGISQDWRLGFVVTADSDADLIAFRLSI